MDVSILAIDVLNIVVFCINLIGILIILWGVVVTTRNFVRMKFGKSGAVTFLVDSSLIRSHLGAYILFGLEFMIASDIIHTIIRPTQHDLIVLATIVAIRTVISYFLNREIEEVRHNSITKA